MFYPHRIFARQNLQSLVNVISSAAVFLTCASGLAQDRTQADVVPPAPAGVFTDSQSTRVSKVEELWTDKPLAKLKASVKPTEGELPPKIALTELFEQEGQTQPIDMARPWAVTGCDWDAPLTSHLPLLFEEPNLERLGYTYRCSPDFCDDDHGVYASECVQPLISGVHFFGRIGLLPYIICQQPLCEPVYTLGVDRPGSPVCYRSHKLLCFRSTAHEQDDTTCEPQIENR